MLQLSKIKKTTATKLLYLGGAVWQGQDIKGVQRTPDLIRQANMFKCLYKKYGVETVDLGNISAEDNKQQIDINKEQSDYHLRNLPVLDNLLGKINHRILTALKQHSEEDTIMLTVGGDHAIGTSTLHALHTHYKDLKVVWVDAHADIINPNESQYPGYHGYPVSHATGIGKDIPGFDWLINKIPFQNIVYIAIREIDKDQWKTLSEKKIKCFTMDHVTQLGIGEVLNQTISYLDPVGNKPFHISFDIDAIDPHYAFGTGTKFRGGLNPLEANQIIRTISHERKLVGLDVVQINVDLQNEPGRCTYREQSDYGLVSPTLGLGIDLINSLFTKYFTI